MVNVAMPERIRAGAVTAERAMAELSVEAWQPL